MTVAHDIKKLADDLERQELEAPSGIASSLVYSQLLAVYLYQNDLCNAKYLWKRIPQSIKSTNTELGHIWTVGQHMWLKDLPATYKAISAVVWSEHVAEIMKAVEENIRSRAVDLICQAYSSVSIDTVSAMTGLSVDQVIAGCFEKNWTFESDTRMVRPAAPKQTPSGHTSSEDQLYKLTEFVSFLEN